MYIFFVNKQKKKNLSKSGDMIDMYPGERAVFLWEKDEDVTDGEELSGDWRTGVVLQTFEACFVSRLESA